MSRACFQFLPPASASHFFTFSSLSRSYFFKFGAVTTATKPCRGLQRSSTTCCARENKPLRLGEILLRLPLNFPPKSERFAKAGWFEIGAFNQRIFNIFLLRYRYYGIPPLLIKTCLWWLGLFKEKKLFYNLMNSKAIFVASNNFLALEIGYFLTVHSGLTQFYFGPSNKISK